MKRKVRFLAAALAATFCLAVVAQTQAADTGDVRLDDAHTVVLNCAMT